MDFVDFVNFVIACIILFSPLLTIIVICCVVRRDQAHIIYYTNLLVANVIQLCARIVWILTQRDPYKILICIYFISVMANVYFLMCLAAERYSLIGCPLLACIRQIKRSLQLSALVWACCMITVVPATVFGVFISTPICASLPAPLFIVCLAGTIKALRAATSVPTEEKRRIVGTLVLLLFNYCLMLVQIWIVWCSLPWVFWPFPLSCCPIHTVIFSLFLLSPFLDMIVSVFMQKGCIDKLLACLCCCSMDSTAAAVSTTSV